jgi:hypothetical protein
MFLVSTVPSTLIFHPLKPFLLILYCHLSRLDLPLIWLGETNYSLPNQENLVSPSDKAHIEKFDHIVVLVDQIPFRTDQKTTVSDLSKVGFSLLLAHACKLPAAFVILVQSDRVTHSPDQRD